jgi:hypothetical protein
MMIVRRDPSLGCLDVAPARETAVMFCPLSWRFPGAKT